MTEDKPRAAEIDKLIAVVLEHSKTAIEDINYDYSDDLKLNNKYDPLKKNQFWAKLTSKKLSPSNDNDAGYQELDSPYLPLSIRYDRNRYIFGKYATDDEKRTFIQNQRDAVSALKDELLLCGEDSIGIIPFFREIEKNRSLSDVRNNSNGTPNVLLAYIWKHREDFHSNTNLRFMTLFPDIMDMVFEDNKEKIKSAREFHNVLALYLYNEWEVDLNPGQISRMISDYCPEEFKQIQAALKTKTIQSGMAAKSKIGMPSRVAANKISGGTPPDNTKGAIKNIFGEGSNKAQPSKRGKTGRGTDWTGQTHVPKPR